MAVDPVDIAVRLHEAINALDFDTIENLFAQDAVYRSDKVGGLNGRDEIMTAFRAYFLEYPDQVAEDSLVEAVSAHAARAVWHLDATSASTGNKLVRDGEETITIDDTGKIVSVMVTDYAAR